MDESNVRVSVIKTIFPGVVKMSVISTHAGVQKTAITGDRQRAGYKDRVFTTEGEGLEGRGFW